MKVWQKIRISALALELRVFDFDFEFELDGGRSSEEAGHLTPLRIMQAAAQTAQAAGRVFVETYMANEINQIQFTHEPMRLILLSLGASH